MSKKLLSCISKLQQVKVILQISPTLPVVSSHHQEAYKPTSAWHKHEITLFKGIKTGLYWSSCFLGFDQQMALCSHWIESICCFKEWAPGVWAGGKGWFSTKTICDNLERDIKGSPAVCSSACLPCAGAHHPEDGELFMPALTLEPRSGLHCHTDPHSAWECGWGSRGRGGIACTKLHMHINTQALW